MRSRSPLWLNIPDAGLKREECSDTIQERVADVNSLTKSIHKGYACPACPAFAIFDKLCYCEFLQRACRTVARRAPYLEQH